MFIRKMTALTLALLATGSLAGAPARAQTGAEAAASFPDKQVRIVVPSTPGGATDFLARLVGTKLSQMWGQPVLVDNHAGAGGIIGSQFVAQSPADGYTLLIVATGYTVNPSIYKKLPYDTIKDFAPVTLLAATTHVLVTHPSVPAQSIKELLALARSKPGHLTYATSGTGTGGYLCGEVMKKVGQLDMLSVAYKGAGAATSAVLGHQTDMEFTDVGPVMPYIKSGQLRALAVSSLQRSPELPDVPTLDESGLKGFQVDAWAGILAPAGTPKEVLAKIQQQINQAVNSPDVKEKLLAQGYAPVASTPDNFAAQIKTEVVKWAKLIHDAGIQPQSL